MSPEGRGQKGHVGKSLELEGQGREGSGRPGVQVQRACAQEERISWAFTGVRKADRQMGKPSLSQCEVQLR